MNEKLKIIREFNDHVMPYLKRTANGCWEWQRALCHGYGLTTINGKSQRANRVALEFRLGRRLGQLHALHHCDNRKCCNPDHLFPGTNNDNRLDAIAKGRSFFGVKGAQPWTVGSKHHNAKLTESDVITIRALRAKKAVSGTQLCASYGITKSHLSRIIKRVRWAHLS